MCAQTTRPDRDPCTCDYISAVELYHVEDCRDPVELYDKRAVTNTPPREMAVRKPLPNGLDSVCEIVDFQSSSDFDSRAFGSAISALDALPIEPLLEAAQHGWSSYFLGNANRKTREVTVSVNGRSTNTAACVTRPANGRSTNPMDHAGVRALDCMGSRLALLQDELHIPVGLSIGARPQPMQRAHHMQHKSYYPPI